MRDTKTGFIGWRRMGRGLAASVLLAGLAGCAGKPLTTGSTTASGQAAMRTDAGESGALGRAYSRNPKDKKTALAYASALGATGRTDQALAVMRRTAIGFPKDRDVLAAYGKALAGAGQLEQALDAVRRAQTPEYPDWKLYSAEGAILDQLNQPNEARVLYRKALDIKPNEPSVLSNLGMSHLLEGDLQTAESFLRPAAQAPGADSRVRQNLALVVGLQGRFAEAEQIARGALSPAEAEANVAYLRSMLAQQNAWKDIKQEEKKATN